MYNDMNKAVDVLKQAGVIAYPTEAVYGFGCNPFNQAAVERILALKNRPVSKGLILIASEWQQLAPLFLPISKQIKAKVMATWPGPVTWLLPADPQCVPSWIRGQHQSVAVRITAHPIARQLCQLFDQPIVSTSANIVDQPPTKSYAEVEELFADKLDYIVNGPVGQLASPTTIRDGLSGELIRS